MIVADTSAWVEYLRNPTHPVSRRMDELIDLRALGVTEIVVMELLAGAGSIREEQLIRSRLAIAPLLPLLGPADFEEAARIWKVCRRAGETVRGLADCLVAVPVIRVGAELLHKDADFDAMARHVGLRIHPWKI